MRLVIDGQRLTAGRTGVGRCLESLLNAWAVTGLPLAETVLVVRDPRGLDRIAPIDGLRVVVADQGWPGLAWECVALRGQLRRDDLLFAPANLVPPNWFGRTVLIIYDVLPWVVRESFPWHVRLRFGWRYRLAANRADRVLVPSEATARDVARVHHVSPERLRVVYPGPEPRFRPLPHDSALVASARRSVGLGNEPFFLFVGKRSKRRNVAAVLNAFARHREAFPTHRLVFAGPDDPGPLPGPDPGVIRAGHVSEDVLHGLMAGAVALLYPSNYEGFGLPVVEGLACGCPVVTLRNSALTEAGGDAAWYLDEPSVEAMSEAMRVLATDERVRSEHVARGLTHAARFSTGRFAWEVKQELIAAARS